MRISQVNSTALKKGNIKYEHDRSQELREGIEILYVARSISKSTQFVLVTRPTIPEKVVRIYRAVLEISRPT